MPSGHPFTPNKIDVINALKKRNGVAAYAAEDLGCCRQTLWAYINNDPELIDILKQQREEFVRLKIADAEKVIHYCMASAREDRRTALNAAMYTLNNLGKPLGYAHPDVQSVREEKGLADSIIDKTNTKVVD